MEYLTVAEAARYIGVTEKTVRRWAIAGRLSVYQQDSHRSMIPLEQVEHEASERGHHISGRTINASIPGNLSNLAQQIQELRAEIRSIPSLGLFALGPDDMRYLEDRMDTIEARLTRIETALFGNKKPIALSVPMGTS